MCLIYDIHSFGVTHKKAFPETATFKSSCVKWKTYMIMSNSIP